ncbi:MAG: energy transducer TonB [Proteobacteria bacterium]|nr:energy transducer TonB [Pseudomonadota bacterium]MBU1717292.1 energy transducer TonB [Pseudomonadota bacterium]
MNDNLKGFSVSFVLHGIILCSLISMTNLLPTAKIVKLIDFSLVERPGVDPQKNVVTTPVLQAPPVLKTAVPTRTVRAFTKISVPAPVAELQAEPEQEVDPPPLLAESIMAEESSKEVVAEAVQPLAEAVIKEEEGGTASAGPEVADLGLSEQIYVKANLHYIKDNIQKGISYPRLAREMGWQGKVIVSFMVDQDGLVHDLRIIKSSGFAALDKNAIATIKKAAPFPCPPVKAELVVPVIYRLA